MAVFLILNPPLGECENENEKTGGSLRAEKAGLGGCENVRKRGEFAHLRYHAPPGLW